MHEYHVLTVECQDNVLNRILKSDKLNNPNRFRKNQQQIVDNPLIILEDLKPHITKRSVNRNGADNNLLNKETQVVRCAATNLSKCNYAKVVYDVHIQHRTFSKNNSTNTSCSARGEQKSEPFDTERDLGESSRMKSYTAQNRYRAKLTALTALCLPLRIGDKQHSRVALL